ncbi:fibronectin type III domain-containing protein, partial [Flavobacteriales bacterium]|nr:fibronectin type III domain-containing protein [Flavobacteriales bacterium]
GQEEWAPDQNYTRLLYRDSPGGVWTEIWSDSSNVTAWTEAIVTLPGATATYQIAFEGINNWGRANVVDEVRVEETPACVAPTTLSSDSLTTSSAEISWTAGGSETMWNIQYGPAGFTPGTGTIISGVTANPYLLTGLTAGTAYDFWVQADCGSDTSSWSGPSTFTTLAPPSCYYIINMEDSYGDGWNGANLQVDVAGIVATVELLAGSSGADTVYAYTGDLVTFTFASGTWDTEITYDIIDPLGAIVFTGSYTANTGNDGLAYTDSSSQSVCAPPSCLPPGNLNAERSTSSSADLSWTEVGSATVWNIEYGPLGFAMGTGTTVLGVTSNPYTLTGLNIETAYDYYVQAVCSSSDSSSFAGPHTFQTLCGDTAAPYLNSFNDSVVDCWAQSGADNFDWTLNSGPTVSGTTGPTDDVTGGGNYFYIESSDPVATGDSAILLTLGIDLSTLTTPQLRFFSHMYGASIGTLKVDVTSDEGVTYTNVFSKSGDQGDQWNEEIVNLSAFSGVVMFRITGVVGDDGTGIQYWSDIAIDDFEVREATGIYEQSSSNFSVYPNPSNGSFFVRNNGATNQYTIKVTDVNGKLIYTEAKTMNGYEAVNIDLEVETGVYLLSVSSKDSINTYRLILR